MVHWLMLSWRDSIGTCWGLGAQGRFRVLGFKGLAKLRVSSLV